MLAIAPATARAEPGPPCEADSCDITPIDPGPRPWILRDECHDDDDVVGYRRCASFGQWASAARGPDYNFELGVGWRHVVLPPLQPMDLARGVAVDSSEAGLAVAALRISRAASGLYAGLELDLGDLTDRALAYGAFVQPGAFVGLDVPVGPVVLGGEALVAARSIERQVDPETRVWTTSPTVEVRSRVAVWVSPWLTVAAQLGIGVLDRSEWFGLLAIGFHTRTFGGWR